MQMSVIPSTPNGCITAIASKSVAHRMLICAAFADKQTVIRCEQTNKDIEATVNCLCALGANITREGAIYTVTPVSCDKIVKKALLPCKESGSTLRFLIPVVAALGAESVFQMEGRLPSRPLSPLKEELEAHGISFFYDSENMLRVTGKLSGNEYTIEGNISSQFITGLLFAIALMDKPALLTVTGKLESAPYVDITLDCLKKFGITADIKDNQYYLNCANKLTSPEYMEVEGDWSNSAFPLALGIMGDGCVSITGLNESSCQGDAKIIELLQSFGGNIEKNDDGYTSKSSSLHAINIDASQIPDLVPILATVASVAKGETRIYGASRLKLKESDRLESVCSVLSALGADISKTDDGLIINGKEHLSGGFVDSFNDHRIAMSAAVAACVCKNSVTIDRAEATSKSYPSFWDDMEVLGMRCVTL